MKSGDILGGLASTTNTVTGLVQGLSSNITKKDGSKATLKDIKDGDFKVNNNFYANIGVNLGFNKSSSKSNSHSESAVVTTIRGKDENSSITYNNVKNVEYVGTQAQDTKFIYNNVENINKTAVELNNSYSSTGKSSGISAGATINDNNGFQAEANAVSISASKSNMNSNGTTYQNGRFVNVDEVHNNTKNMTLSGFNQEGGTVTGNIENLTIESKQNTSTTKGSTKGGSLSVSANGLPSGSANYSQTNGERKVVDNASTFIIGDGSNLKVGKVENTAAAIGTTGSGKLSIDEYVGYNLENVDKLKTVGASVGVSTSGVTSIGVNYSDKKQEGITKNTVIGNVEIGKSSGDEINRDLDTMTEITEDRDFKTNINVESQTINYIKNPEKFKEDLQIAIIEGKATGRTVVKTIDNVINGDKSQDIGDAERRSLIEIKEAIVRVQTAPAMDIIAEKDLADKNVQKELGVVIEKFDPNDPTLSEKVRERIDELKAEGKELVAFYDKVTKKIFINQNAKDEEVRASIAREYKIKEDLKLGRGKENDKGQLRSTVAGEIAYDEIKNRLKKGDKNPISTSSFDVAKMDKDSEVTSDIITKEDREFIKYYKKEVLPNDPNYKIVRRIMSTGYNMTPGIGQAKLLLEVLVGEDLVTGDKYDIIDTISTSFTVQKSIAEQRLSQMKNLSGREKIEYLMKNQNIVSEDTSKLIEYNKNNGTITNNQLLLEYKPIKMLPGPYKDLTTSQNLTGLNSSTVNNSLIIANKTNFMPPVLYRAENTALVLYKSPNWLSTPVATNRVLTTAPLLMDGANKINQVPSSSYTPILKLPVKYPNLTDSENKFLNDYMGKEIPGKIVSKYNDVNKYEYNATTNPGPLANSRNQPIKNFYGGMYSKRILTEPEIYFRAGDTGVQKEYGSYYTKDFPKSSIQVRTDSAVKLYWLKLDGELDSMSPLNRVYMIEFPAGTEVYEGPIGYQEGRYLGGLKNEQIYIEDAWKKGTVKSSFPLEKKKELVIPSEIKNGE